MKILSLLGFLTIFPAGAAILALPFLLMYWRKKTTSALVTGLFWLVYAVYEYLMYTRVLCSGECNIRVDLLVIYPLLIGLSLLSLVLYWRKNPEPADV